MRSLCEIIERMNFDADKLMIKDIFFRNIEILYLNWPIPICDLCHLMKYYIFFGYMTEFLRKKKRIYFVNYKMLLFHGFQ